MSIHTATQSRKGFTIVELLIVVVVIAILAAITIVAYNGISNRAKQSAVQASASQANTKVKLYAIDNAETYPALLSDAGIQSDANTTYQYTSDNTSNPHTYAITATSGDGTISYYVSNTQGNATAGIYPEHSLFPWNKFTAGNPLGGGTLDSSQYHTSAPSVRIGPNVVNIGLNGAGATIPVTTGQVYRVSIWIKTDASWNGTAGNSKIRFGDQANALIGACGYDGPKTVWTNYTCSYTVTTGVTGLQVQFGNNGSIGNIWLDDIMVGRL